MLDAIYPLDLFSGGRITEDAGTSLDLYLDWNEYQIPRLGVLP